MKIEKLAALAEIIAAFAIVLTLGYLAIQTSQNTAATNSSARQASLDAELSLFYQLGEVGADFRESFSDLYAAKSNVRTVIPKWTFVQVRANVCNRPAADSRVTAGPQL